MPMHPASSPNDGTHSPDYTREINLPAPFPLQQHIPGSRPIAQETSSVPAALPFSLLDDTGNIRSMEAIQADVIRFALQRYNGQMSETARRLDIGRSTLYRKLHGMQFADHESDAEGVAWHKSCGDFRRRSRISNCK